MVEFCDNSHHYRRHFQTTWFLKKSLFWIQIAAALFLSLSFYLNPSIWQISKINVSRNTLKTSLKRTKRRKEFKRQGYQRKASFNFNMNKQEGTKNPETAWSKQTKVKLGKQKHGKWLRLDDQEKLHKNNITSQWLRIKLERNNGDEHTVGRKQVG